MTVSVASYLNLYQFPTGRRMFALARVHAHAHARGIRAVADAAQRAIDHDRDTQNLELRRLSAPTARYSAEAQALDNQVDRAVVGLASYLASQVSLFGDRHPRGVAATELRRALFPNGTRAVISMSYVQEHSTVNALLVRLHDADLAKSVQTLPELIPAAEHLRQLNEAFGAALGDSHDSPTTDQVRAAQAEGQELMARVVALILAHAVNTGDDDATTALLQPVLEQNEAIRDARRRRRPPLDIDPDSGIEVATALATDPQPQDGEDGEGNGDDFSDPD